MSEHIHASDTQLHERLMELVDLKAIEHGEERRKAIAREIAHIVFEQGIRYEEAHSEARELPRV